MKPSLMWIFSLSAVLLAACTTAEVPAVQESSPAPTPAATLPEKQSTAVPGSPTSAPTFAIKAIEIIDLTTVPEVDTSRHSVPLDEIIFDTFQPINRAVPLTDIQPALIRSLRDAIPPLYEPRFSDVGQTDAWLAGSDLILGYADGDEAYAYPVKILNFHEMVSHRVNGRDILASYCPLCGSGIVYDRLLTGTEASLTLGNTSALYESDMVMFDHQTGSYWNQVSGEAIVGPLTGRRMSILPAQMATWDQWKDLYPETLALSENTGFERNYRRDPFAGYGQGLSAGGRFAFPVSEAGRDPRLDAGEIVLSLEVEGERRAYPLVILGDGAIEDELGDIPVVVFSQAEGPNGAAYLPFVDDNKLTFIFENGRIQDLETGSTWNMAGLAVEGDLAGAQLEPLPARTTFWFSLVANFPDVGVFETGK